MDSLPFTTDATRSADRYWDDTMARVYSQGYLSPPPPPPPPPPVVSDEPRVIDVPEPSIKDRKATIKYWQYTMSEVYKMYPSMR